MNIHLSLTQKEYKQFQAFQELDRKAGARLDYIMTLDHLRQIESLVNEALYLFTHYEWLMDNHNRGIKILELLQNVVRRGVNL